MHASRKRYGNLGRNSGVRFYALGPSSIRVWFKDGDGYDYDYRHPGREHVETMKRLAEEGRGLSTYISQHVRKNYARKL
ncbi:hypothetical protein [Hyphomicrobium sp. DMF-1]|uniref:hypothetical protein n=2 Tax=Hyphomicrobium TaxID=81 RepID=UPI0022EBEE95|nr:hypothetical protein [Hyphomicrobium sp. DMF-1]WBT36506.1 hypothetical protein PE058_12660 [Hyphomicrobium sp. DMF-1]